MYGAPNGSPLTKTRPQANRRPKSTQAQASEACLHSPKDPPQNDNEDDECNDVRTVGIDMTRPPPPEPFIVL